MLTTSILGGSLSFASRSNKKLVRFLEDHTPWLFAQTFDEFYLPFREESKKLRLAHQPNFLPSIAVIDQFFLGEHLAKKYDLSFEYLSMDYEACQNERYRTGYLLKVDQNKLSNAKLKLPYKRDYLICNHVAASANWVSEAMDTIRSCRRSFHHDKRIGFSESGNTDIARIVEGAFAGANKQVEVNQRLIQSLVELSSPIISGSERLIDSAENLSLLLGKSADINKLMNEAADLLGLSRSRHDDFCPMWYVSDKGRRTEVRSKNQGEYEATGNSEKGEVKVQFSRSSLVGLVEEGKIIPRIVADDLLDAIDGRFDLGIAYISGIEHYIKSAFVAVGLGLRPMPEFFSTTKRLPTRLRGFETPPPANMISAHFARDVFGYDPEYTVASPDARLTANERVD